MAHIDAAIMKQIELGEYRKSRSECFIELTDIPYGSYLKALKRRKYMKVRKRKS